MTARTGIRLLFAAGWVALALAARGAQAQEASPFARARLAPAGPVIVGEPVRVIVDVLVPNYFTGAPQWPDVLDVEDAIARLDETARANFTENVAGATFAGQTREYIVYTQLQGGVTVPPVEVPVRYALESGQPVEQTLRTPPLSFEARVPAEAAGLGYFFATSSFRLTEQYDPPATDVRVGDAVTRTVTMRAVNSSAILLPPVEFAPVAGVGVYPREPLVNDSGGERDTARTNERVDAATFVFERPGAVRLPEITVSWWDTGAARLRTASLPARTLEVEANPGATPEIVLPEDATPEEAAGEGAPTLVVLVREWWRTVVLLLAALLAGSWVARRYGRRAQDTLASWRRERANSEAASFRRLRQASHGSDPRAAYTAALAWLDRLPLEEQAPTLETIARTTGRADLSREIQDLMARLYGQPRDDSSPWSGRALYEAASAARGTIVDAARRVQRRGALPELNPRRPGQ